jgi:Pyruvate/2-oxoacid:ferredoxin oxidoreductase delta subunit
MLREIITIDEGKCNGCGLCVPGCPEGAIQIIDGKARLISDLFCDGLGACLGHCPEGAITIEKREAQPYDERRVMENIIKAGPNTIKAHLAHLREHGETAFLQTALDVLDEKNVPVPGDFQFAESGPCGTQAGGGCPGSTTLSFGSKKPSESAEGAVPSELSQWPVQLHLVSPNAPYFRSADVVLAADCTAFAVGDFHRRFLRGKALAIACPKLDEGQEIYLAKLTAMIDQADINTLTVVMMQVPCCGGLLALAKKALASSARKIPIKKVVVGLQGEILQEGWV